MAANALSRRVTSALNVIAILITTHGLRRTLKRCMASLPRAGKQNSNAAKRQTAPINVACIASERDRLDWEENN